MRTTVAIDDDDVLAAAKLRARRPGVDFRSNRALAVALEHGATVVSFDRDFARFDGIDREQPD